MIYAIHHIQITIPPGALTLARDFYGTVLGLKEIPKPDSLKGRSGLWFELGAQQIHIGVEENAHRSNSKSHIAYQVADLESMRSVLKTAGCNIIESVPIKGLNRFETRDPFGNRLEFLHVL